MKRVLQKMKKNNHTCIGSVGRSKGLNGEFYLNSFCNPKENIIDYIKDIVFLSDSKLEIEYIKKSANKLFSKIKNNILIFEQKMFYYKFNLFYDQFKWQGTKATRYKNFFRVKESFDIFLTSHQNIELKNSYFGEKIRFIILFSNFSLNFLNTKDFKNCIKN